MWPYRVIKHSKIIKQFERKKNFEKKIFQNNPINLKNVYSPYLLLDFFPRFSNISKKKSFCAFTKKPRSVFKKFAINRIAFRDFAHHAQLNGIQKSSW